MKEKIDKTIYSWLINCPPSDENFRSNLARANMATTMAALNYLPKMSKPGVTRRQALERRLRKLQRSGGAQ